MHCVTIMLVGDLVSVDSCECWFVDRSALIAEAELKQHITT